jgi:capsular polysaccharide biosynthesis protein
MRDRGFEIVVPGALTLTEQIRVFREASLVVGPHGAGLTNIVFCEPGTIVYELVPDHYPNVCFTNLALICRLRYWADSFISEGDGHPSARDWDADLSVVAERIDEIETLRAVLSREAAHQTVGAMDFLRGAPGRLNDRPVEIQPVATPKRHGLLRRLLGR